ncbi:RHS repeat-associated protein, partial [Kribbella sp. VKM Ac-2569]|uniref:RHS repeat-associated core domain-containing protein n=1 Tax=Kribbella sp. VKM Ac-2569 TaxID=2512220 RepID=UPI00102B065F
PYRFNSKRFDGATGTYDMGFREYNPGLNRYLSRDYYNGALQDLALGTDPWNTNRYAFAGGNPISGIELDGHIAIDEYGEQYATDTPDHDRAVIASVDPAHEWMRSNGFEGEVTIDTGSRRNPENRVEGAGPNGGAGYPDLLITGKGKDEGTFLVYEVKPNNAYGHADGPKDLQRYIKGLQLAHPGAVVKAGPDLRRNPFPATKGKLGTVWSNKRWPTDARTFPGMRWYGTNDPPKTPSRPTQGKQNESDDEEQDRRWLTPPQPDPNLGAEVGALIGATVVGGVVCLVTIGLGCAMQ